MVPQKNKTDIIKDILGKEQSFPDVKMPHGKYGGDTLETIYKKDRKYLLWILSEDYISKSLRDKILIGFIRAEGKAPNV